MNDDQRPMDPRDDTLTTKVMVALVVAAIIGLAIVAAIVTTP